MRFLTGPLPVEAQWLSDPRACAREGSCAARFVAGLQAAKPGAHIANARSQVALLCHGDFRLPVTIENGDYGGSYVASPHSAYVLYARDEIDIIGLKGASRFGAKTALGVLDRWLKALAINRTVHIDNWMLSTNLHGHWDTACLPGIRRAVIQQFPAHLPVIRCVDPWSCPDLFAGVVSDGWVLLPARQIWVTDDLEADWKPRSHTKSDHRALRKSRLCIEEIGQMNDGDAHRIADLYAQLYLGRYSSLNPAYTARFVQLASDSGALRFRVARTGNGTIMASAGMRVAGGIVTVPMLGYDTSRPQNEALYRIASLLSTQWAMERGYRHHGSAGAGTFKSNRGARGQIEYMAVYTEHLSQARRQGIRLFAQLLERVMVPTLQREGW